MLYGQLTALWKCTKCYVQVYANSDEWGGCGGKGGGGRGLRQTERTPALPPRQLGLASPKGSFRNQMPVRFEI